jgi:hypothetical protein
MAVLLAAGGRAYAQDVHLVLVTGLGGDPAYTETFHDWASTFRRGALEAGVRPERIAWFAEDPDRAPDAITGRSTLENLEAHLERLASAAGRDDRVLLVLIGHGTSRNEEARFNLPGPDLTGAALADLLGAFGTRTVAVVNTAPSSGPWIQALAGPDRIVVTATKTARERNETQFGGFFARAFRGQEADLDKDERVSLLEAFRFTAREVERHYEEQGLLLTEHAVLEDDGDGRGTERFGEEGGPEGGRDDEPPTDDGALASRFWLTPRPGVRADAPDDAVPAGVTDPELRQLYVDRAALEDRVAELRSLRETMEEEEYERRLEALLVELALKNRAIREKGGGS